MKISFAIIIATPLLLSAFITSAKEVDSSTITAHNASSKQTIYIRKNASSPDAAGDLKALDMALKKMRAMKCTDPRSWYYQGATHSIPNVIGQTKKPANPLCPSYTDISKTSLLWGWKTCTHRSGSELHFLIWHRLYIAHFEAIVRQISGKADFALPYWDYVDSRYRDMPAAFRDKTSNLYTEARLASLNKGKPIEKFMNSKLDVTDLFEERVYANFNSTIDTAPHGAMHNYIGAGYSSKPNMWNEIYQNKQHPGLMAEVDSAGFDPIFWMHHSNIDYLWQQWESSPRGARPTLSELQKAPWPYQFINADGSRNEYTIEQAYLAAFNPDYVYDQAPSGIVKLNTATHTLLVSRNANNQKELVWSVPINKSLSSGKLSVSAPKETVTKSMALKGEPRLDAIILKLNTKFTTQPSGLYSVYIIGSDKKKKTAGIMSFFGAVHHATSDGQHTSHRLTKPFTFDVTDEISLDEEFTVVIEKDAGENSDITIERMELIVY